MVSTMMAPKEKLPIALVEQGLTLRHWHDDADFDRMAVVLIASRNFDALEEARSGDALKKDYARMKNINLRRDVFLVERDGELVAYAACRWNQERSGAFTHTLWIFVHPNFRGRGIENELLQLTQARQREQTLALAVDAENWFEVYATNTQTWLSTLLVEQDYQPVRYFYDMLCKPLTDIPNAELPPGIETRPVVPADLRRIWDAEGEAFAESWGEHVEDESDFANASASPRWQPGLWQVAWDGEEVVGMVRNYVDADENERYRYKRGYTENISVRKQWRGRGVAKALLVKSMKMFRDRGFDHTALGVDAENPTGALQLYTSVGYKPVRTETVYRKKFES